MDFDDIVEGLDPDEGGKDKVTASEIEETMTVGTEMLSTDLLPMISKIKFLKPWLKKYNSFVLADLGWAFNFGTSKQWAGLCSSRITKHAKSVNRNIYVSIDFVEHDRNWMKNMVDTVWHEMAHAVIQELVVDVAGFRIALLEYDIEHRSSQGHGILWREVCKQISGENCPQFYENADFKETFKNWKAECLFCGHKEYSDHRTNLPSSCRECKTEMIVEEN